MARSKLHHKKKNQNCDAKQFAADSDRLKSLNESITRLSNGDNSIVAKEVKNYKTLKKLKVKQRELTALLAILSEKIKELTQVIDSADERSSETARAELVKIEKDFMSINQSLERNNLTIKATKDMILVDTVTDTPLYTYVNSRKTLETKIRFFYHDSVRTATTLEVIDNNATGECDISAPSSTIDVNNESVVDVTTSTSNDKVFVPSESSEATQHEALRKVFYDLVLRYEGIEAEINNITNGDDSLLDNEIFLERSLKKCKEQLCREKQKFNDTSSKLERLNRNKSLPIDESVQIQKDALTKIIYKSNNELNLLKEKIKTIPKQMMSSEMKPKSLSILWSSRDRLLGQVRKCCNDIEHSSEVIDEEDDSDFSIVYNRWKIIEDIVHAKKKERKRKRDELTNDNEAPTMKTSSFSESSNQIQTSIKLEQDCFTDTSIISDVQIKQELCGHVSENKMNNSLDSEDDTNTIVDSVVDSNKVNYSLNEDILDEDSDIE